MNHEDSVCLAQTAHGWVSVCACGCTSLTFGRVTLHFDSEAAFEGMAETVLDEERARREDEEFEMRYDWFSVSLSPLGSAEFAQLLREAMDALKWARGDMEFTDEDLRRLRRPFPDSWRDVPSLQMGHQARRIAFALGLQHRDTKKARRNGAGPIESERFAFKCVYALRMVLGLSILLTASFQNARPTLRFADPRCASKAGVPFERALDNLDLNAVPYDPKNYNPTGLMNGTRFLRAGGGYDQPWTRDASINSWNAASLFASAVARDTLWSVTRPGAGGAPIVQRDNQWWDKVVWIVGAWSHYRVTGDRAFLATAYGVSCRLLGEMRAARYESRFGLFQGPSFFNDGIAGYPAPPAAPDDGGSSFVLDHPGTDRLMALSTNCVYVGAYQAAAAMAKELGQPDGEWKADAEGLKAAIDRRFWMPERKTYGYLLNPLGRLDPSQEGCGLAFAVLFDVASPVRAHAILRGAHVEPSGMTDVYPSFPRYSDERPGRHNAIVWPMIQGMWARAAAKTRDVEALRTQVDDLARLVQGSDGHFFEIYNPKTGRPDGGWQNGRHWDSAPDQTWSATAYLSMVTNGLFGMRFEPKGLRFEPLVPKGWGDVTLSGVPYRGASLDLFLKGSGMRVRAIRLDGKPLKGILVPGDLTGRHSVEIAMR